MKVAARIAICSLTIAASIAAVMAYTAPRSQFQTIPRDTSRSCDGIERLFHIDEPALTAEEVEARLLAGQIIFGHKSPPADAKMMREWRDFSATMKPGDSIFSVTGSFYGGYAIIHDYCVVDEFVTWMS